jgi:hypothetical protein
MYESIQDITMRLMRYQRTPDKITSGFKRWKHNKDILPILQRQLEMILWSYGKFQPIVYDTQGILDDGSDLILRHREDSTVDQEFKIISFQVKSYDDLRKKNYMQELKAQRDDSFRKVLGLSYYFLVLCTDGVEHKNKIRNIAAEFRSAEKTEVIEPGYAYTFMHHPQTRIDAFVKRTLEAEDIVFKKALDVIEFSSPSARALAIFIAVQFATGKTSTDQNLITTDHSLKTMYDELRIKQASLLKEFEAEEEEQKTKLSTVKANEEDDQEEDDWYTEEEEPEQIAEFEEQVVHDLDLLEDDLIDLDTTSNQVIIRAQEILPLSAVIIDAFVRYEYDENEILPYMFNLFGVSD